MEIKNWTQGEVGTNEPAHKGALMGPNHITSGLWHPTFQPPPAQGEMSRVGWYIARNHTKPNDSK